MLKILVPNYINITPYLRSNRALNLVCMKGFCNYMCPCGWMQNGVG